MFRRICMPGFQNRFCTIIKQGMQSHQAEAKDVFRLRNYSSLVRTCRPFIAPKNIQQNVTKQTATVVKAYAEISEKGQKYVGRWLLTCAGMSAGAVMIGGITRLTESGLSITKWDPVTGVVYPYNETMWKEEFDKYKQTPQYKYLERELTLSDFKFIYFMEWFHRIWGRWVGTVFVVPAFIFWRKGWIASKMKPRILILGALIATEACLGIFMVNSGLEQKKDAVEVPRVSQYRLAAHLGTALLLYVGFIWTGLNHLLPYNNIQWTSQMSRIRKFAHSSKGLIFLTALSGAFVAGLDAGLVYNTWPKFADRWIPSDLLAFTPKWKNLFENHTTVQFTHRHLGELTGVVVLATWLLSRKVPLPSRARLAVNCMAGMAVIQIALGVTTLLTYVPTHIAASHQSGALVLLSFAVWLTHELRRMPK